jgi:orotidine 5'-phosphate decarboxylase subfamily 1
MSKSDIIINKLKNYITKKKSNLCFSADIDNPYKVIEIVKQIGNYIVICKIHFDIYKFTQKYTSEHFIHDLTRLSNDLKFMIMEDRKFFDISYIVEKQFSFYKNWVDLVTVHGLVNDDVIKKIDAGILLVVNMSNNNYDITNNCLELCNNNDNIVGFITQKNINYKNLLNFTPGISFEDKTIDDQKYRNINNISNNDMPDIIIIGRAIYDSDNILETIQNIG